MPWAARRGHSPLLDSHGADKLIGILSAKVRAQLEPLTRACPPDHGADAVCRASQVQ